MMETPRPVMLPFHGSSMLSTMYESRQVDVCVCVCGRFHGMMDTRPVILSVHGLPLLSTKYESRQVHECV